MEEVYDLHQHTHCVYIYIGEAGEIVVSMTDSIKRYFDPGKTMLNEGEISYVYCNKKKSTFLVLREGDFEKDYLLCDNFLNILENINKKDRAAWNEEDEYLIESISDFFRLIVKDLMEEPDSEVRSLSRLHYVFIVPSKWAIEIQEDLIRPIFIQSDLISKEDHNDRLLFITDLEALFYLNKRLGRFKSLFKRGQHIIVCRCSTSIDAKECATIKLDLIKNTNTLFDFSSSMLYPQVVRSNTFSIDLDDIKGGIKKYVTNTMFPDNEKICKRLFKKIYRLNLEDKYDFLELLDKMLGLNDLQIEVLNSIRPIDICSNICDNLYSHIKEMLPNNNLKKNYQFSIVDEGNNYEDEEVYMYLLKWASKILEYTMSRLSDETILSKCNLISPKGDMSDIVYGASKLVQEYIQYSDMHCPPRIIPRQKEATSLSIFLDSRPDAIINIDISLKSTVLSCSFLKEDGLVEKIIDHSFFIADKCLPSLDCFYKFSDTTTLGVKENFISLAEEYLLREPEYLSLNKDLLLEIETILQNDSYDRVLTHESKFIKAFLFMYLVYIGDIISDGLAKCLGYEISTPKVGYAVPIENILLYNMIGTKEDLREFVYASNLIKKNDELKKLRITTQGEGILPTIQRLHKSEFPVKSFFLLAQLHEDYIQLTLNQIVTPSSPEDKQQEAIIVEDKIIFIKNIYDSLGLNMWNSLIKNNTLIELCDIHHGYDNQDNKFELFSLETKTCFMENFKEYISKNILVNNSNLQISDKNVVKMNNYCNCNVHLNINDIIEIAFKPFLKEITFILSASLTNDYLFGKYLNIDYYFSLIYFNQNLQLLRILKDILEEESENFNPAQGIDAICIVIPELPAALFQSTLNQQPLPYKDFQIGALHRIYNKNYGLSLCWEETDNNKGKGRMIVHTKNRIGKTDDITTMHLNSTFPFIKEGEMISNAETIRELEYSADISNLGYKDIYYLVHNYETFDELNRYQEIAANDGDNYISIHTIYPKEDSTPVMFTVKILAYSSAIVFKFKRVGGHKTDDNIDVEIGYPLTLSRF